MGKLFGSSGIRGIFNEVLTAGLSLSVGRALSTYVGVGSNVVIGSDHRTTKDIIKDSFISGLLRGGAIVYDVGIAPTPTIAYIAKKKGFDVAISVTASHNPPEYNGLKFWNPDGSGYTQHQEEIIESTIFSREYSECDWSVTGRYYISKHLIDLHIRDIIDYIGNIDSYNIVIDCGCASSSVISPYLLKKMNQRIITLNCDIDGYFRSERVDIGNESDFAYMGDWPHIVDLNNLSQAVRECCADFGVANDGDADRVVFIDENGRPISQDMILAKFSEFMLEKNSGAIVTTVDASLLIDELGEKYDIPVIRTKVGDVFVSSALKQNNGIFGGEPSGTFIFPDFHYCPDGIMAIAMLIKILSEKNLSMSELFTDYNIYPVKRIKIKCENNLKKIVMSEIKKKLPPLYPEIKSIIETDGLRIQFPDNDWILIRPSGTEPVIRITAESKDKNKLSKIVNIAEKILLSEIEDRKNC